MIKIIGIKRKRKLIRIIKKYKDEDITITFVQRVNPGRTHHLWHGGRVALVSYRGWQFSIEALGDVIGYLYEYDGDDEQDVVRIKDKSNGGWFEHEMDNYLKHDRDIHRASADERGDFPYRLELDYGNWWEIIPISPDGREHDIMWSANDYYIFDAIDEAIGNAELVIRELSA